MKIQQDTTTYTASPNEEVRGRIRLVSDDGKFLEGYVYTDEPRLSAREEKFFGREAVIHYAVKTCGLIDGDIVRGHVIIASVEGEHELPVEVRIREVVCPESFDRITDLHDFTELARRDAREAFRMFKTEAFMRKLTQGNTKAQTLLRGLKAQPVTIESMEEFLVLLGLKNRVEVSLVKASMNFNKLTEPVEEYAALRRSGWGALVLHVSTKSPLLELPCGTLTDDDFVGSVCDLPFRIRTDLLEKGQRTGTIHIRGVGVDLALKVTASMAGSDKGGSCVRMGRKRALFLRTALDFECGRIHLDDFRRTERNLILEMREPWFSPLEKAFASAYVFGKCGDREGYMAALDVMNKEKGRISTPNEAYLLRHFLKNAPFEAVEDEGLGEDLQTELRQNPANVLLLVLAVKENPDARRLPLSLLESMRRAFDAGCTSPFLYAEAWQLYAEDPSLLDRMDSFTKQVLIFAVKEEILTEEIALRAAFLADLEKMYTPLVFRILAGAYGMYPIDSILESLCRLLIKGPARDPKCFPWYARAIDRDFRITRLYEYYIETMPESYQKVLPLSVRLYFARDTSLSDKSRAFLYANIVRNRNEDPETFARYEDIMRAFSKEALAAGKMGTDYAALYQTFADLSDTKVAEQFAEVVFTEQIFCDNPRVRRVICVTPELAEEESSALVKGAAFIQRYTDASELLFEDAEGRRYRSGVSYSEAPLIDRALFLSKLTGRHLSHPGVLITCLKDRPEIDEENLSEWAEAAESDTYAVSFQQEARMRLLTYASLHTDNEDLDAFIDGLDDEEYARVHPGLLLGTFMGYGLVDRAFELVDRCGTEHMRTEDLIRLTSFLIEEEGDEENKNILLLATRVFARGKYDERILHYLVLWYNSSLSRMMDVRRAAEGFYIETYRIDERILARCIFSGTTVEDGSRILRHYSEKGGNPNILVPYVKIASAAAFDKNETVDPYLGHVLGDLFDEERCEFVMKMAYLQYLAGKGELTVREEMQVDSIMDECMQESILFAFMKKLPPSFVSSYHLLDKEILEFREDPDAEVILHYSFDEKADDERFTSEPMRRIFRGVHQKIFTLFYGEKLTWYVTVRVGERKYISPHRTETGAYPDFTGRSRYQRINQMLRLAREGNEEELKERLLDYRRSVRQIDTLFSLKEEP
ncbi:MAG: DUF5717 family protein [Lachnospiraceae bacterium]|nr:DUF5717 family protein [Lachnospiraceae bacterium]